MSAGPLTPNETIIEGTLKEILRRAPKLAGHQLRDLRADSTRAEREAWAADLSAWALNRSPLGPWDDSRDAIDGAQGLIDD